MRSPAAERDRERLIEAILPDVPFDGWTRQALRGAAERAGIPAEAAIALFPRGAADLVAEFSHWADRQMLARLAAVLPDPHPIPPALVGEGGAEEGGVGARPAIGLSRRVALALNLRFEVLLPWREGVRRGLPVLAVPPNAPLALRLLYDTVDAVWRGVGDHPADFSFYTKRATLAAIQASATLYWLDDRSPEFVETRAFIDRRLADLHRLTGLRERLARVAEVLPNPLRLLRPQR